MIDRIYAIVLGGIVGLLVMQSCEIRGIQETLQHIVDTRP